MTRQTWVGAVVKSGLILVIASTLVVLSFSSGLAEQKFYLPIITRERGPVDFRVAAVRLWDVYENGGTPSSSIACGHGGRVQVHVFDRRGDIGPAARVDNTVVRVVQNAGAQRSVRYFTTGVAGPGEVEFAIAGQADITLVDDDNGRPVISPIVSVTADLHAVNPVQLADALYCSDSGSCAVLIASNTCAGGMSWTLVFVRNY